MMAVYCMMNMEEFLSEWGEGKVMRIRSLRAADRQAGRRDGWPGMLALVVARPGSLHRRFVTEVNLHFSRLDTDHPTVRSWGRETFLAEMSWSLHHQQQYSFRSSLKKQYFQSRTVFATNKIKRICRLSPKTRAPHASPTRMALGEFLPADPLHSLQAAS